VQRPTPRRARISATDARASREFISYDSITHTLVFGLLGERRSSRPRCAKATQSRGKMFIFDNIHVIRLQGELLRFDPLDLPRWPGEAQTVEEPAQAVVGHSERVDRELDEAAHCDDAPARSRGRPR